MINALVKIWGSTPFLWHRGPGSFNLTSFGAILVVVLGLIITTRIEIHRRNNEAAEALASLLPSAVIFAVMVCLAGAIILKVVYINRPYCFESLVYRFFALFALLILFSSIPSLLHEFGFRIYQPLIGRPVLRGGEIQQVYQIKLTTFYVGFGILGTTPVLIANWFILLAKVRKRRPQAVQYTLRQVLDTSVVAVLIVSSTWIVIHITFWGDLPPWLAVVKPS